MKLKGYKKQKNNMKKIVLNVKDSEILLKGSYYIYRNISNHDIMTMGDTGRTVNELNMTRGKLLTAYIEALNNKNDNLTLELEYDEYMELTLFVEDAYFEKEEEYSLYYGISKQEHENLYDRFIKIWDIS